MDGYGRNEAVAVQSVHRTTDQIALRERLIGEGTSVREAAKLLKCHHATLYRALSAPAA